jgi:hypothetical protein
VIRNIEEKRDRVSEEVVSNDSVPPTSRKNSRARNNALALDRTQDEHQHTNIVHSPGAQHALVFVRTFSF